MNESYHSKHGAIQESVHVFIDAGLNYVASVGKPLSILEIGFGTGLNALLTQIEAGKQEREVKYTAIEAFPLENETWQLLNYPHIIGPGDYSRIFSVLHLASWNQEVEISDLFRLHKINIKLEDYQPQAETFDLIYFDAFSPSAQPELWTAEIFEKMFKALIPGGVLVTYCVKGEAVRAMRSAGFNTVKLPGPPGKRHITRACR